MKATLLLSLVLVMSSSLAQAAPLLRSEYLKSVAYRAIESKITWAEGDPAEDLGEIWLGKMAYATFEVAGTHQDLRTGNFVMDTHIQFVCGSWADESELPGTCDVELLKGDKWTAGAVRNCTCDYIE